MPNISEMSSLQLAYAAQQLISHLSLLRAEPIAIIGMGCRFPGKSNALDDYWQLLAEGREAISEIPADRFDVDAYFDPDPQAPGKMYCRYGGFLDRVDLFDARHFNISPREAQAMDPQQRLFLEVTWDALSDAALSPESLYGSNTGVYVGISTFDYAALQLAGRQSVRNIDPYYVSGTVLSVAAGRISYLLGIKGPSLSVDTACSSSLVSTQLACEALRRRECDLAITGGVGLMMAPQPYISFCKAGMLAPDGRCKTFDEKADGYGRGEGCGVLLLKRYSDALADGNPIWAVIRGSCINQDGASGGLTVPSGPSQEAVIRQALQNGGIEPETVDYVEAHGTGTRLGDPIELNAIGNTYGSGNRTTPLIVGAAKTNFGHLEAAAGVAGIIKVVLSFAHSQIPPHIHFDTPTRQFNWDRFNLQIPSRLTEWPTNEHPKRAGVSSFGFCGTNAHLILEAHTSEASSKQPAAPFNFNRKRFWVSADKEDHPPLQVDLPGQPLNLPFSDEVRFECRISADFPAYVRDHQLFGTVVLAGASHLSMILEGITRIWGEGPCCLEDVMMHQPLILNAFEGQKTAERLVQLVFSPMNRDNPTDGYRFKLISAASTAIDTPWQLHATGQIAHSEPLAEQPPLPPTVDDDEAELIHGADFYALVEQQGHTLGPSFRWLTHAYQKGHDLLSFLEPPQQPIAAYRLHPGIFDTCFQLCCIQGPSIMFGEQAHAINEQAILVPFSFDRIVVNRQQSLRNPLSCRLHLTGGDASQHSLSADFKLIDDEGKVHLDVSGFGVRRLERSQLNPTQRQPRLYHMVWEPADFTTSGDPSRHTEELNEPQKWLILADNQGRMAHLAEALKHHAHHVDLIQADNPLPSLSFFSELLATAHHEYDRIVFGGALDVSPDTLPEETSSPLEKACMDLIHLVQAINQRDLSLQPKLYIVTRVGWALSETSPEINPFQAGLWGLGRVIMLEEPTLECRLIDLIDNEISEANLHQLLCAPPSSQLTFFNNTCRVARLTPLTSQPTHALPVKPDRTYLITGGTGAIGRETAQFLIRQGARHLVLTGRRSPDPLHTRWIDELKSDGVHLRIEASDISQATQVKALLDEIAQEGPKLGGIIHAAGVLDDALIADQDSERFRKVMAPKVWGAWHLHRFTQDMNLDFMVFYASMASLLGNPGQANYAAANAFLDGLANLRHQQGTPAISINWAGWAATGMAAPLTITDRQRLNESGIDLIAKEDALGFLKQVLTMNVAQAGVLSMDWPVYAARHGYQGVPETLQSLVPRNSVSPAIDTVQASTHLISQLEQTPPDMHHDYLSRYIWAIVADLLGLDNHAPPDTTTGLFDLGLDSIMAVQLKERLAKDLGRPIRSTLVFNYPTVSAIAEYLLPSLLPEVSRNDLDDLSETDLGSLLDQKLSNIDQWIS